MDLSRRRFLELASKAGLVMGATIKFPSLAFSSPPKEKKDSKGHWYKYRPVDFYVAELTLEKEIPKDTVKVVTKAFERAIKKHRAVGYKDLVYRRSYRVDRGHYQHVWQATLLFRT